MLPLNIEKCSNMDIIIELYAVEHESQHRYEDYLFFTLRLITFCLHTVLKITHFFFFFLSCKTRVVGRATLDISDLENQEREVPLLNRDGLCAKLHLHVGFKFALDFFFFL